MCISLASNPDCKSPDSFSTQTGRIKNCKSIISSTAHPPLTVSLLNSHLLLYNQSIIKEKTNKEMGNLRHPISTDSGDYESLPQQQHPSSSSVFTTHTSEIQNELDAGALFVLRSEGSWVHCSYHLTTTIVSPCLLSLPFAFASLGWIAGVFCLVIGASVTFYSYNLISLVLEHNADIFGIRHLRFRDMAHHILGPRWGRYYVGPTQLAVCYGAVIGTVIIASQCMQSIYTLSRPNADQMKLHHFVLIFGTILLILAQIPSFHSLRHINLVSLILCLAYSACATAGSIYVGNSSTSPPKDYSLSGDTTADRVFGVFKGIAIIASSLGNGIIPEIQATLAPPVRGKMFKGLSLCYMVVTLTFFSVAISGYWAFGKNSAGTVLSNFITENGKSLVPKWFLLMTNVFTLLQISAVSLVYLQPMNEVLERNLSDPKSKQFSARNVVPRLISRSLAVIVATTIAALLPFFGDINALVGAFGFMPLDFILPVVLFNLTFKPWKRGIIFLVNSTIVFVFSIVAVVAAIAAVRQITLDAKIEL